MRALVALASLCALTCGCRVFDPALYPRDGAASTDDAALPALALAEDCSGNVPMVVPSAGGAMVNVDTTGLADDQPDVGQCTGAPLVGADGFFAMDLTAGELAHVHLRNSTADADPAIYFLSVCDGRACTSDAALDECGRGKDEHLAIRAATTGRYFVGVGSRYAGGARYAALAYRVVCGDGVKSHGEACDSMLTPDTCTTDCHVKMSANAPNEVEPNDDVFGAGVVELGATGTVDLFGSLGGRCDSDTFAVDVPQGGAIDAELFAQNGQACDAAAPPQRIAIRRPDGRTLIDAVQGAAGAPCPRIGATQTWSRNLPAGRYFLRVGLPDTSRDAVIPAFSYTLRLRVGPS